jgi:purine-binding chemotaxis protein CheW
MQDNTSKNTSNNTLVNAQAELSAGEYLTFILGNEEYGIEILKVQEIRSYETVTKIANTPDFIKGVINLRGSIVPIIDLRMRFNLSEAVYNEFTVVIILNFNKRVTGIVVDGVSDVLDLTNAQISPVPELVSSIDTKYLLGLGSIDERMLILIDIERLMTSQEMALVEAVSDKAV